MHLAAGASCTFLGFALRRVQTRRGAWGVLDAPTLQARTALLAKLRAIVRRLRSQPVDRLMALLNPIRRGWVQYFRVGHASRCFGSVKDWVEQKVRQPLMRARQRQGCGWKRWRRSWLYDQLGLYNGYRVVQAWTESAPSRDVPSPLRGSAQESPVPENGTLGLTWRELETA